MQPNLDRITGDGDARARAVLHELPATVSRSFLDSLDDSSRLALGRYGIRQTTVAYRTGSVDELRGALMATALAELLDRDDPRDTMIRLAIHVHVARALGLVPSDLFAEVAGRVPAGELAELFRTFGARDDVTLEAFGWDVVETPHGPDFVPHW